MAAGTNRDVTLGVGIKTTGEEALRSLAQEVQSLAKRGGEAAPAYQQLANELQRLSQQAAQLESFKALAADVEELAAAHREAKVTAQGFGDTLRAQQADTERLRESQDAAKLAVRQAANELTGARLALEKLRAETSEAGKQTASYDTQVRQLKVAIVDAKSALAEKRNALAEAADAAKAAGKAERELADEFERTDRAAEKIGQNLREQQAAMRQVETAAESLGLSLTDVATAEQKIIATQQRLAEDVAFTQQAEEARKWAEATAKAAAEVDRLAAEAAKLNKASEYTKWWRDELERLDKEARAAAEAMRELEASSQSAAKAREEAARAADEFGRMAEKASELNRASEYTRWWAEQLERVDAEARAAAESQKLLAAEAARVAQETQRASAEARKFAEAESEAAAEVERLTAQAAQMVRAAEYTRWWRDELERLDVEAKQSADSVARLTRESNSAADVLRSAFGQTGVRSLAAIDAEISNVERSMSLLERKFKTGAISADDLARASSSAAVRLATLKREMDTVPAISGPLERMSDNVQSLINRFGALGAAVATVAVAVRPVVDATVQLDQMRRVLTTVTGSAEAAAREIEFVRDVAQRSGLAFGAAGESYAKFAASAVNSGISMTTVRQVFENTAMAAGNLGLSADATKGILEALSQMAGKGVVSMEELRGQLGDRLPGALSLMAKGLGLTDQQLIKLVESGKLLSSDALPALAEAMLQLGPKGTGVVEGIIASWNRLKNVLSETTTIITDGAFGRAAGAALGAVSSAAQYVAFGVAMIGESFTVVGKQIGTVTAAIVSRDFKNLSAELQRIEDESAQRLGNLADRITGTGTAAAGATPQVAGLAGQAKAAADAIATGNPALEQQAAHLAAVGTRAEAAGKSWVQLQAIAAEQIAMAEKEAVTADTLAKAKKTEADARSAAIALSGDEVLSKQQAASAAADYTAALDRQATADERVAELARKQVDQLRAKAEETKRDDEATRKALETLEQSARGKEADAERTRQQADASRVHAASLKLQADAMADNSGKVALYRSEVDMAAAALAAAQRGFERDLRTKQDVQRATQALAEAQGRLKDAVNDAARALDYQIGMLRADQDVKVAGLRVELERAKAAERIAVLNNDEASATAARIKQKELEIQLAASSTEWAVKEATMRKEAAEAELRDTINIQPEKERELNLRIANAKAKIAEAQAGAEATKAIQAEISALRQRATVGSSGGSGGSGSAGGAGAGPGTLLRGSGSTGSNSGGLASGIDGSGMNAFTASLKQNGSGVGQPVDASYVFTLRERLNRGDSFSAEELPAIRNALRVAQENARLGSAGSVSLEGRQNDTVWVNVLSRIVEQIESSQTSIKSKAPGLGFSPQGTSRTVNINLNGKTSSLSMASEADAARLEALLQEIAAAAGRST